MAQWAQGFKTRAFGPRTLSRAARCPGLAKFENNSFNITVSVTKIMSNTTVKPANGKLGVLVVGLGAVTSTFMTGVLMARKGLAKPVGSMTQYDKIRVGKGADKKYLKYEDIVPMAKLDDIVFGA